MTFEDRLSYFCRLRESGHLRLDPAQDKKTGRIIGYCVSSVSADNTREIESLFVDREFRSAGIGTALVPRGLGWMDSLGAVRNRVSVGDAKESAWAFYRKFGFYLG